MATVIMALLYVLEGAILTVTAVVTGIKHSEFPDVRVGYHVRDAMESKEKWNDANVIAGLVSGVFAVIFFAAAILVYWNFIIFPPPAHSWYREGKTVTLKSQRCPLPPVSPVHL